MQKRTIENSMPGRGRYVQRALRLKVAKARPGFRLRQRCLHKAL